LLAKENSILLELKYTTNQSDKVYPLPSCTAPEVAWLLAPTRKLLRSCCGLWGVSPACHLACMGSGEGPNGRDLPDQREQKQERECLKGRVLCCGAGSQQDKQSKGRPRIEHANSR
jgi:hypothetical protein